MRIIATLTISVFFLSSSVAWAADGETTLCSVLQWPKDFTLRDQTFTDVDNDGLKDLVLSDATANASTARALRIYKQRSENPRFHQEPDWVVPLTPDVIAYAFVQTSPDSDKEILLFTAGACFGYRLDETQGDRITKLIECDFLWQLPDAYHAFSWQQAVRDFNDDGKDDVFWPQTGGFRLLMQQDDGFAITPFRATPRESRSVDDWMGARVRNNDVGMSLELRFRDMGQMFGYNLSGGDLIHERRESHVPVFVDFDGDSHIDVLNQTRTRLVVWSQGSDVPSIWPLPLDPNDSRVFDMNQQYLLDLDRDSRCDFVLFSKDENSKSLATQILIYKQNVGANSEPSLFGVQGVPAQLLKIAGLPSEVQWADVNQDGYPDLSFLVLRPDLLDQVKTLTSRSLQLQSLLFLNDKGRFSRTPDMIQEVTVAIQDDGENRDPQGRFLVDYNGDGLLDLFVQDSGSHIGLRLLRRRGNNLSIDDATAWDMTIPQGARIVHETSSPDDAPVLFIIGDAQILYVRFK